MNRIQIIGRLTANPELKSTNSGVQICTFTVAVNRRFNREETDYFPVIVWRESAVHCNKYLAKGSQVAVCGSIQIRKYEDKDGIKHTAIDFQAEEVEFLSGKNETKESQVANESKSSKKAEQKQVSVEDLEEVDEELPF